MATTVAQAGNPDRAASPARTITDPDAQANALTGVATAIAQAGDPDRAYRLVSDAEAITLIVTQPQMTKPGHSPRWLPRSPRPGTPTALSIFWPEQLLLVSPGSGG